MAWVKAASLDELRTKPIVFKHPPLQIALFHTNGRIFAVDNRCPHEGYPLASGTVSSECVLTCNWHNWKFRLEDGQCIMGGDNVRAYATRLDGENVWIDVSPLPSEETQQTIMHGLRKAFSERDYGRICREIARLHFNGLDPKDAIRAGIRWSYDRHEPGATDGHAYAGAADWLFLAETFGGDFERRLICYAEAVDHMALVSLRQPEFAYAPPGEPFARDAFLAAIEAEDLSRAEGMVARALADGLHWPDLQEAFVAAALAHYEDFGHSVIYTQKLSPLISELGGDVERCLLLLQARHLCYAMKEDRIPEFKDYSAALEALPAPRWSTATPDDIEIPFPCNLRQSFHWLSKCLAAYDVPTVYNALLKALAQSLLHYHTRFGTSFDRPVSDNVSWLGFTHGVTFANAARVLCTKHPEFWRPALLQMACFLGRNVRYLDSQLDPALWRVSDRASFFADAHQRLLDHGINEPIFAVHLLKTTLAVEAELPYATPLTQEVLMASLNRFLQSPLKMKHVRRLARQAIALVSRDFER